MNISIIIPNFNGFQHLKNNLPGLINAIAHQAIEVIIVDNGSKDQSIDYLKNTYPQILIIRIPSPIGFSRSCNIGAKKARSLLLLFLNNDVAVSNNFFIPLIKHFDDDKVFAVTPSIIVPRMGNLNEALTSATFKGGAINVDFYASRRWKKQPDAALPILFGCGAALMVDKEKFSQLGGFDELYSPFYCEDLDLSYRAQRRGWKVLCEPKSIVYHLKEGTIASEFKHRSIAIIRRKNQYIFIWKNIFDIKLLLSHFFELLLVKILIPNITEWIAIGQALAQLPAILIKRQEESHFNAVKDRAILDSSAYFLEEGEAPWQKHI
ncbi:MAG: glycosyltransferase family 2 protein [Candidatus Margulisbacteria bacterium]|nr:glycosyltransferase family 2 protein [Candidatus Margulisiibacteriota bacterium]